MQQTKRKQPISGHSAHYAGREGALAGRVVAITGAASGIGRAVAIDCAKRGATLALADLLEQELTDLQEELEALGVLASQLSVRELDVRVREQVHEWAAEVGRTFGPAHAIVNCAGVSLHCPLDETTFEDFAWVMDTNFWGVVHGTQAFLPQFQRAGRGHVINVSSLFGLMGFPGTGAYAASKFAVRGFTETLAIELGITHPGIDVSCLHPGGIKTPLVRNGRVRGRGPIATTPELAASSFDRDLARTSAASCASQIVGVMLRPRSRVLIGADARLLDWGVRLFPSFYRRLVAWGFRRAVRANGKNP